MPFNLIGAIAQGLYKPQLQATQVDANGNYLDAQGNPTTLYSKPGFIQKALNPYADQINQLNLQVQSQGLEAQRNASLQRAVAEKMTGMNDTTYGQTYDPRFSPSNINTQLQAQLFANQGGNQSEAAQRLAQLTAGTQEAYNRTRQAATSGLLGNPETAELIANKGLNYQAGEYGGLSALQPGKFQLLGTQQNNEQSIADALRGRLPDVNNALSLQANTEKQKALIGNTYESPTLLANSITGLIQSENPAYHNNPMSGKVDLLHRTITPGLVPVEEKYAADMARTEVSKGTPTTFSSGAVAIKPSVQSAVDPLNPPVAPSVAPSALIGAKSDAKKYGIGDSITGYTEPENNDPIAGDEALLALGLKIDKDGNLQKANNYIDVSPDQLRQGQIIQNMIKTGKMPPSAGHWKNTKNIIGKLEAKYLGSWPTQ